MHPRIITPSPPSNHLLSLHHALPIFLDHTDDVSRHDRLVHRDGVDQRELACIEGGEVGKLTLVDTIAMEDRKSTRLNSSHVEISYAVFCLIKHKKLKYCRVTIGQDA